MRGVRASLMTDRQTDREREREREGKEEEMLHFNSLILNILSISLFVFFFCD